MDPLILAIALYFVALLLAVMDIFVPSGGILLILSAIAAVCSVICGFRVSPTAGLTLATVVLGTVPAFVYVAIKIWPHTPIGRRILLSPPKADEVTPQDELQAYVGTVVLSSWPLMPTGQIKIGRQLCNARSLDGGIIEAGGRVKVVDVQERVLVVISTTEPLTEVATAPSRSTTAKNTAQPASDQELLKTPVEDFGLDSLENGD